MSFFFFFQAEDGIRDAQESRGLGDVYKRQSYHTSFGQPPIEVSLSQAIEISSLPWQLAYFYG